MTYHNMPFLYTYRTAEPGHPLTVTFKPYSNCAVQYIEHVVIEISLDMSGYSRSYSYSDYVREVTSPWGDVTTLLEHNDVRRGDLSISLTSPSNTTSMLLPNRRNDIVNVEGFNKWPFMSVLHWGETPLGEWILNFTYDPQRHTNGFVTVTNISVTMYGTSTLPKQETWKLCDPSELRNATDLQCVRRCQPKFKVYRGYCIDPDYRYHPVTDVTSDLIVTFETTETSVTSDPAVSKMTSELIEGNVTFEPMLVVLSGAVRPLLRVNILLFIAVLYVIVIA